jgi:hypothetical protein
MENNAVLFVQASNEVAQFRPEDAFEGPLFRRDDMDVQISSPQRSGNLQANETCADHANIWKETEVAARKLGVAPCENIRA